MRNHTYDDENKYQEYYDAAWDEIEPSNKNRNTAPVKPASDSTDKIFVPVYCPKCMNSYEIKIAPRKRFNYQDRCPVCKTEITVSSKKSSSPITVLLCIIVWIIALVPLLAVINTIVIPLFHKIILPGFFEFIYPLLPRFMILFYKELAFNLSTLINW